MRVLLVEDDKSFGEGLAYGLADCHFNVELVHDGEAALRAIESGGDFDVIVLDVELPGINGFEVLKTIRAKNVNTPVIMLTARGELDSRLAGFNIGADDYVLKPVALEELIARIEALRRRSARNSKKILAFRDIKLNPDSHKVHSKGKLVELSRREFTLLQALLENVGRVVSREHLTQVLYGWKYDVDSNALEVHIHNLRKKFGDKFITTIRGIGYIIEEEDIEDIEDNDDKKDTMQ
jgi:two-component system, OmpR family, response regulator QseB